MFFSCERTNSGCVGFIVRYGRWECDYISVFSFVTFIPSNYVLTQSSPTLRPTLVDLISKRNFLIYYKLFWLYSWFALVPFSSVVFIYFECLRMSSSWSFWTKDTILCYDKLLFLLRTVSLYCLCFMYLNPVAITHIYSYKLKLLSFQFDPTIT